MAKFKFTQSTKTRKNVSKNTVFYVCCFRIPDHLKDNLGAEEIDILERDELMGFYSLPSKGALIEANQKLWRFVDEIHSPVPYKARAGRKVPKLLMLLSTEPHPIPELSEGDIRIEE